MKWLEKMKQRPDTIHIHTDYRDVPLTGWAPDLIQSAEVLKSIDERQYRWVWLGQCVGIDEAIYYMFCNEHMAEPEQASGFPLSGSAAIMASRTLQHFRRSGWTFPHMKLRGLVNIITAAGNQDTSAALPNMHRTLFSLFMNCMNSMEAVDAALFVSGSIGAGFPQEEIKRACPGLLGCKSA